MTTLTLRSQFRALAKSYQLKFSGRIYNDFRIKHNRFKFYFVNPVPTPCAGLCLEFKNEYPNAKVEFKNYRPYAPAGDIIISFKK